MLIDSFLFWKIHALLVNRFYLSSILRPIFQYVLLDNLNRVFFQQLPRMKTDNLRLKEIQGKELRNFGVQAESGNGLNSRRGDNYGVPHGTPPSKSSYNGSSAFFRELLMHQDSWEGDGKSIDSLLNVLSSTSPDCFISPDMEMNRALAQQREVALKRSLFSLVLSFMVGMTIWEAGDLCVPLVMALFAVVGMSLVSGVQLFSTIKNKPASDAVALLSLNWFILGVLSYPTLPRFTRILVTTIVSMLDRTIRWLGASSQ